MNSIAGLLLAAESHYWFHLRNPLRDVTSQAIWQSVAIGIGLAFAVAVGVWLVMRLMRRRRERLESPWGLFRELCAAHRLTYRERSLLKLLAARHALPQPGTLFVEPRLWDGHDLGAELRPHVDELRTLRERLFARS